MYNRIMGTLKTFKVKDIRCFSGSQHVDIRPVTILAGENSTGKTTLLSCYHHWMQAQSMAFRIASRLTPVPVPIDSDFNIEPYHMGTFKNIARSSRTKFSMGMIYKMSENDEATIDAIFKKSGSMPALEEYIMSFSFGGRIIYRESPSLEPVKIMLEKGNDLVFTFSDSYLSTNLHGFIVDIRNACEEFSRTSDFASISSELKNLIESNVHPKDLTAQPEKIVGLGPVQSKPRRTYDPISETPSSTGKDVPTYMVHLARTSKKRWGALQRDLAEFGQKSEMFKKIEIKQLGNDDGDPFQIEFDMGPHSANIKDVGYGVSQILPILVKMMSPATEDFPVRFLLQQPEVHLHPQAQAAFASLVAQSASSNPDRRYLIETHSDYIINRIQLEIRNKTIRAEDVALAYHEKTDTGTKIHNITFDKRGDPQGVPPNYRDFFLDEAEKLIGF